MRSIDKASETSAATWSAQNLNPFQLYYIIGEFNRISTGSNRLSGGALRGYFVEPTGGTDDEDSMMGYDLAFFDPGGVQHVRQACWENPRRHRCWHHEGSVGAGVVGTGAGIVARWKFGWVSKRNPSFDQEQDSPDFLTLSFDISEKGDWFFAEGNLISEYLYGVEETGELPIKSATLIKVGSQSSLPHVRRNG